MVETLASRVSRSSSARSSAVSSSLSSGGSPPSSSDSSSTTTADSSAGGLAPGGMIETELVGELASGGGEDIERVSVGSGGRSAAWADAAAAAAAAASSACRARSARRFLRNVSRNHDERSNAPDPRHARSVVIVLARIVARGPLAECLRRLNADGRSDPVAVCAFVSERTQLNVEGSQGSHGETARVSPGKTAPRRRSKISH